MKIFDKILAFSSNPFLSFQIGCPEAEGEIETIKDYFEDSLGIIQQIANGKFIICGRKGSGKSAIAEYVMSAASSESQEFVSRIDMSEIKLHEFIEEASNTKIDYSLLTEWIIYNNIIKLLIKNEKINNEKEIKELNKFVRYNIGLDKLNRDVIQDFISTKEVRFNVENLLRITGASGGVSYKQEFHKRKPYYFEMIPILREVLKTVCNNAYVQGENASEYLLFVDDLDVYANIHEPNTIKIIYELIKTTRNFNLDFPENFKVILLLRDDISQYISHYFPDSGKIFSSYSTRINWYDASIFNEIGENHIALKKFINKRIKHFFINAKIKAEDDPWYQLIDVDFRLQNISKSSFAAVLQSTYLRPRDIILFFKEIAKCPPSLPIKKEGFDILFRGLADEIFTEICNELKFLYSIEEIKICEAVMKHFSVEKDFSQSDFNNFVDYYSKQGMDSEALLKCFWDYSIIGNIDRNLPKTEVYFSFRGNEMDSKKRFIIATPIRNHFNRNHLFY